MSHNHNHSHNRSKPKTLEMASLDCVIVTPRNELFGASALSSSEIGEQESGELPIIAQAGSEGVPA